MLKHIYGIYDSMTHNFGDICILDRDEEFRDGCIDLLSNPAIPDYVKDDLVGVCYGDITFDSGDLFPHLVAFERPRVIFVASSPSVQAAFAKRKSEVDNDVDETAADC